MAIRRALGKPEPAASMKLVMQSPYPRACQQACLAMLAGRTLDEVIAVVGHVSSMSVKDREKVVKEFGLKLDVWKSSLVAAFAVEPYQNLAQMMREHRTIWCSVYDSSDHNFAHAVIIHDGNLYDPHAGMNPTWPWSRVIGNVSAVDVEK